MADQSGATQALQYAFEKLGDLAHTYGPPAVEAASTVIQVDAIQTLLSGFLGGLVPVACIIAAKPVGVVIRGMIRRDMERNLAEDKLRYPSLYRDAVLGEQHDGMLAVLPWLASGAAFVASAIGFLFFVGNVFDVWAWTALFNPKLALAHEVMKALTSKVG